MLEVFNSNRKTTMTVTKSPLKYAKSR